jgi:hypothetical protein
VEKYTYARLGMLVCSCPFRGLTQHKDRKFGAYAPE